MTRDFKYLFFAILFVLLPVAIYAQSGRVQSAIHYDNVHFNSLNIESGLSNSTVYSITQDNRGFMWFGTKNGLCKYDGYGMEQYFNDSEDPASLTNDFVNRVFNHVEGDAIWIATEEGVCRFDYDTQSFVRYTDQGRAFANVHFMSMSNGELLLACRLGIYKYDKLGDCFKPFLNEKFINGISEDSAGRLWISTRNKLKCYSLYMGGFVPKSHALTNLESIASLRIVESDVLLYASKQSVYIYDIEYDRVVELQGITTKDFCRCITKDSFGNMWIGSESGVFVYDKDYKLRAHYSDEYGDQSNLNDSPVYSIFSDREKNVWVGTYFGGVNYYSYGSDKFKVYSKSNIANTLSGKVVREIINGRDGELYIATEDGGLNMMTKDRRIVRSNIVSKIVGTKASNVHGLLVDSRNNLWVAAFQGGLMSHNLDTSKNIIHEQNKPQCSVFSVKECADGSICYSGPFGLSRSYPQADGSYVSANLTQDFKNILMCLNDSTMLVGSRTTGLERLDLKTNELSSLLDAEYDRLYVTYIFKDSRECIWVATNNDGLLRLDSTATNIVQVYTKDQLGSNAVKSVIEDDYGNIWVGTENGLCCIDAQSNGLIRRFTSKDGLPINLFNYASVCKRADGELFFGTIDGMISFYPEQLVSYAQPRFGVRVTGAWSGDDNLISGLGADELTLDYEQAHSLRIEYSAFNYQYGSDTQYAILVEGVDSDWQYVGAQHQAQFYNLPTGKYNIKIKASSDGVNWDELGVKQLSMNVKPAPWFTLWAYLLYFAIVVAICYLLIIFIRARIRLIMHLRNEHSLRLNGEALNREKINFFTYISHDLKTPLTLILSPLNRMVHKPSLDASDQDKLMVIYRNAKRMHYLIDELLLFSKTEMRKVTNNIRRGDVMAFIREVATIFDDVAQEREIDFKVEIDDKVGQKVFFSLSKLDRILYNLLSNAFKYTPAGGSVVLAARIVEVNGDQILEISVKDTGRGIPKEMQERIFDSYYQVDKRDHRGGFGLGLSLVKSLVLSHKGDIKVDSIPGVGTEFVVTLNVSQSAFSPEELSQEQITQEEIEQHGNNVKETLDLIPNHVDVNLNLSAAPKDRPSILIVEDNEEMNTYLCEIFADKYIVHKAFNGKQALELLERETVSIIITDVMMPVMDGMELVRRAKDDIRFSHIPIIMLTAKSSDDDITDGYMQGVSAYVTKPFNATNLELMIKNIDANRRANIEQFRDSEQIDVTPIVSSSRDEVFMNDLVSLIAANMADEEFGIAAILEHFHISRSLLHLKVKAVAGVSTTHFIRTVKMKEAKLLLRKGLNVSEVSFAVGISDPNYFTKCFKKEFDLTPSEFVRSNEIDK